MLARIAGVPMDDLADIDPVLEEMEKGAATERLAAECHAFGCDPRLRKNAMHLKLDDQLMHGSKGQVALKEVPDGFGFGGVFDAAILSRIRSPVTSRSNCANDSSTLSVSLPMLVVVIEPSQSLGECPVLTNCAYMDRG